MNKKILLALTCLYYILTVLPHEIVGSQIGAFFKPYGRHIYDTTTKFILLGGVALIGVFLLTRLTKNKDRIIEGLFYIALTIGLIFLAMETLIIINVEAIHFLQYAILAILIFFLTGRYFYTALIVLLLAFFDESYQHFFLTPNRFEYLDFNDIFLDQIGMGGGLTILFCLGMRSSKAEPKISQSILWTYGILIGVTSVLWLTGVMRIWPVVGEPNAPIQIMQRPIEEFWQTVRKVHKFHIMRPWEGVLSALIMTWLYGRLDRN